jgi:hypothetical protein
MYPIEYTELTIHSPGGQRTEQHAERLHGERDLESPGSISTDVEGQAARPPEHDGEQAPHVGHASSTAVVSVTVSRRFGQRPVKGHTEGAHERDQR